MPTKLLWLDLETTGLSPACRILEASFFLTDFENPFKHEPEVFNMVLHYCEEPEHDLACSLSKDDGMDPYVREMHTKNGLLDLCKPSYLWDRDLEKQLERLIPEAKEEDDKVVLAGSTIGFDMSFLRFHMPALANRLSYRLYDVSAVKLFARTLGHEKFPKNDAHRASTDIVKSWEDARALAKWFGKLPWEANYIDGKKIPTELTWKMSMPDILAEIQKGETIESLMKRFY